MKKIINILSAALVLLSVQSCLQKNDVFEKSASERIQSAVDNVRQTLVSSKNGWVLQYWIGREYSLYGYNVLLKFDNQHVTVAAEYVPTSQTESSTWDVNKDQGPVLTIDTYNSIIHQMSQPSRDELDGKEGDFEFVVQSVSANEIHLKGKKFGNHMKMTRMPEGVEWKSYLDNVKKVAAALGTRYKTTGEGVDIRFDAANRRVYFGEDSFGTAFVTTEKGIELCTSYEVEKGKFVDYFDVNLETQEIYNPAIGTPEMAPPPLNERFLNGNWYIKKADLGSAVSSYFKIAEDYTISDCGTAIKYLLFAKGNYVHPAYPEALGFDFVMENGDTGWFNLTTSLVDEDKVKFAFAGTAAGKAPYYFTYARFSSIVVFAIGYSAQTYTLTCDDLKNPTWIKLVNTSNPNKSYTVYAAPTDYNAE